MVKQRFDDNAKLTFERVGDENFLSKIETADLVFSIAVSQAEVRVATEKSASGTSASGSSAGQEGK